MNSEYERLLHQYNVPAGVLTADELKLLKEGGIRLDDSDDQAEFHYSGPNRQTQIKYPRNIPPLEKDSLKLVYQDQLSMKQKQINYLQNEIQNRDRLLQAERLRIRKEFDIEREKSDAQIRKLRAKIIYNEGQIPLIKEAVNQVREMLSGMVSESTYLRLKDLPQKDLPPSQWLLVNIWEMVYPYRKELDFNRKQVNKLRQEYKIANDKQHSLLNQVEHYGRLLSAKDDDEKRHIIDYENSRKNMEIEIQNLRRDLEQNRDKGLRYDELMRDYQFTKQQKDLIEEKINYYHKDQQTLPVDVSGDQKRRQIDLLNQDKQHLTKQNIQLLQINRNLEDKYNRMESNYLKERNKSEELFGQLVNLKSDSVKSYEQRIFKEIQELKIKHNHQVETAKNTLVDIYEKQIRFLKEELEEKQLRLNTVERNLREKTKQYEQTFLDSRDFQRKFDTDLAQTRIQLKIRTEQLDRISNIYQQTLANLNAQKLDNERLSQKYSCIKSEYFKSEANAKDQTSELKAQVAVMREQLANYQLIQKQLDNAVMTLGQINPNDEGIFKNTIHSVPTSNKRRIQQALSLAQRLQAKQKDHQETQLALNKAENDLEQAKQELRVARSLVEKSNQPYSYLVNTIQEKEQEILNLRREIKKLDEQNRNIKDEYREQARQLQQAESDVKRLLIKRESIQNIQNILIQLTQGPTSTTKANQAIQEIRDILGSTQMKKTNYEQDRPVNQSPMWYQKLLQKKK